MAVTPVPGDASTVVTGGTAVTAVAANPTGQNGGIITNPASAADQGVNPPEPLYVNPVDSATLEANGNTFEIGPGQSWLLIPGQTTATTVNALTSGHKFTCIKY